MKSTAERMLRTLAMRGVIAVLPVAMVGAYAGGNFVPAHRQLTLDYAQVAEIAVAPNTVGIADSHLYGMTQADIDRELDQLQALGVQDIRVLVPWGLIEVADNTYNWSLMDRVMTAAAARNMGVMADINATPPWASQGNAFPGASAPPPEKFAEFVQQVALKYGSTVSAYEIWNEPNAYFFYDPISPETYTDLLKAAYPVIKQIDPTATVVAGALGSGVTVGTATLNPVDFVNRMYAAGAKGFFDALSFHPYQESLPFSQGGPIPNSPINQLTAIKALMANAGDSGKLVWISEYGLPTNHVTEQQQADYISNLLNSWQNFGNAGPVFIYTARDVQSGTTNPEDNYGIYNTDWTPKLAAEVIRQFIAGQVTNPIPNPFEQFARQLAQALSQLFAQLVNAQITAFLQAIAAALAGAFSPPPAASPLTLRAASVAAPEEASLAVESVAKTAEASVASGVEPAAAAETATSPAAATAPVAAEVAPVTEAVPELVTVPEVTVPVVTVPVVTAPVVTVPEVTAPVVTVPELTAPVVSTPVATAPVAASPAVTAPAATAPAATTSSDTTGTSPSSPAGPSKTADDGTKKGTKHDDAAKSGAAEKSAEKPAKSAHPAKVKGDNGSSIVDAKPKVGVEGITAGAAAENAPSESAAAG